jgi:hypothetical protein
MAHGGVEGGASQQAGGVGHFGGQPSRVTVGDNDVSHCGGLVKRRS